MLRNNYRSLKCNLLVKKVVCAAIMLIPTISMAVPLLKYQIDPGTTIATIFEESNPNIDREEPLTGYFTVQEAGPDAPLTEAEEISFGHAHLFKIVDLFFQSESYELTKTLPESDETYNILATDTCSERPNCGKQGYFLTFLLNGTGFNEDPDEAFILDASTEYTGDKESPEKVSSSSWVRFEVTDSHRAIGFLRNFSATRVDPPIDAVAVPELSGSGMALGLGMVFGLFALMRERHRPKLPQQ